MKMTITHARKVQIAKFWCLKSSTNIWLSCGIINSFPKINKIELEGRKDSKSAKIGKFFTLKKMFGLISPNEGHEGIISQLFSGSIVADLSNGILHLPGSQNFYFPASWQVWRAGAWWRWVTSAQGSVRDCAQNCNFLDRACKTG